MFVPGVLGTIAFYRLFLGADLAVNQCITGQPCISQLCTAGSDAACTGRDVLLSRHLLRALGPWPWHIPLPEQQAAKRSREATGPPKTFSN